MAAFALSFRRSNARVIVMVLQVDMSSSGQQHKAPMPRRKDAYFHHSLVEKSYGLNCRQVHILDVFDVYEMCSEFYMSNPTRHENITNNFFPN